MLGISMMNAQDVVDGFGVNTHFNYFDTTYHTLRDTHLIPAMLDLGVLHARVTPHWGSPPADRPGPCRPCRSAASAPRFPG